MNAEVSNATYLWLHGIGAYTLVLLLFWKTSMIIDSMRRTPGINAERITFVLLALLLITVLSTGLFWTFIGPIYIFGASLLTIHILAAATLVPILVYHVIRYRWIINSERPFNRRTFTRVAATTAAGYLVWFLSGRFMTILELSGSSRRFTGSYHVGSFNGKFPSVSWINDRPPALYLEGWRLDVVGAVEQSTTFTYQEILAMESAEISAVLDCTGGWYSEQLWRGVRLVDVLEQALPAPGFKSVTVRSGTGFQRRFSVDNIHNYILAYEVAYRPLSEGHGFPLRLVAPDQRGVNWVKWVDLVTVHKSGSFWQTPLPLQ